MRRLTLHLALASAALAVGCGRDDPALDWPVVAKVSAAANPNNALSLVATVAVRGADSARLLYAVEPAGPRGATPFYPAPDGQVTLTALGLLARTDYTLLVEAKRGDVVSLSSTFAGRTGDLPDGLRTVELISTGTPEPGYLILPLGSLGFAAAFDADGQIAWYKQFPLENSQRVDETDLQPNGHFTSFVGRTAGSLADSGNVFEYTPAGTLVRTWSVSPPLYLDEHEFLLTGSDAATTHAYFFTYDRRTVDLSPINGPSKMTVVGHMLASATPGGPLQFLWNAWDAIPMAQWPSVSPGSDFDHTNAFMFDGDGSVVLSIRNLNEVRKIDATTGATIWRLGGKYGDFTFVNDPLGGPSLQHAPRMLDNGHLLLYDNGVNHTPRESRAVEYALDFEQKTATLVWEYRHTPAIYTAIVGYVQRFTNGKTLVAFGWAGTVNEVSPDGTLLWEGRLTAGGQTQGFYRARRISSLYQFGRP